MYLAPCGSPPWFPPPQLNEFTSSGRKENSLSSSVCVELSIPEALVLNYPPLRATPRSRLEGGSHSFFVPPTSNSFYCPRG